MSDTHHSASKQTTGGEGALGMETAGEDRGDLEFDPVVPEAPAGKKPTGILIILLVVGLAVGMLFSMRTLTRVSRGSGQDANINKIEKVIDGFLGHGSDKSGVNLNTGGIDGYEDVVHVLTDNYTKNQVKELGRNPFVIPDQGTTTVAVATGNQCERAAAKMVLKSVMGNSLANINGRIVKTGQVFPVDLGKGEGTVDFKLREVTADSATVECIGDDPESKFEKTLFMRRNN